MNTFREDLDAVIGQARDDIHAFRGMRLFLTGGTGFVGTWLMASIVHANARLGTKIAADVLTRDPGAFTRREPALASAEGIRLIAGDVRDSPDPHGTYDGVVHAATPASANFNDERPSEMLDTIVDGHRTAIDIAARSGHVPLLFTSSGAVYGRQPPGLERVDEEYTGGPNVLDPRSAYHEGKRIAELMCAIAAQQGAQPKVARLFAFVGPYLPLDRHFAIGNFLRDAMRGGPIVVGGNGTPFRSYLYASDLAVWLWAIFARGENARAYNVGSEDAIDIATLARAVADAAGGDVQVETRGIPVAGRQAERYIPDTTRARRELRVAETVALPEALRRTVAWHQERRPGVVA